MSEAEMCGRWATVDTAGRLRMIRWEMAEQLAEDHLARRRMDCSSSMALLAVAVREATLSAAVPDLPISRRPAGVRAGLKLIAAGLRMIFRRRGKPAGRRRAR